MMHIITLCQLDFLHEKWYNKRTIGQLRRTCGMWANESAFYQIYPLGFCGAPFENDGNLQPRILKVLDWVGHIKKLGTNAIYFSSLIKININIIVIIEMRKWFI